MNRLKSLWAAGAAALADLFWPPVCAVCPRLLPLPEEPESWEAYFCPACRATAELLPAAVCPVCGRPFYHSPGHLCGDCLAEPPPFAAARAAAAYQGAVALAIGRLKYQGDLSQTRPLGRLAAAIPLDPAEICDVIVPLPLSPRRLAARGFNQALALARAAFGGRGCGPAVEPRLLSRSETPPQAALNRRERLKAVRGAFRAPAPGLVRGARVLLFDDVVTTGATAAEAARTLLAAGAQTVRLAAVARTVPETWR